MSTTKGIESDTATTRVLITQRPDMAHHVLSAVESTVYFDSDEEDRCADRQPLPWSTHHNNIYDHVWYLNFIDMKMASILTFFDNQSTNLSIHRSVHPLIDILITISTDSPPKENLIRFFPALNIWSRTITFLHSLLAFNCAQHFTVKSFQAAFQTIHSNGLGEKSIHARSHGVAPGDIV